MTCDLGERPLTKLNKTMNTRKLAVRLSGSRVSTLVSLRNCKKALVVYRSSGDQGCSITNHYASLLVLSQMKRYEYRNWSPLRQEQLDKQKLLKRLNLGKVVDTLQEEIPDILTKLISSDLIASDIVFRICPTTHDKIPVFKGYMAYVTTAKALQLFMTQFILNPNVKVHIINTKIGDQVPSEYGLYRTTTKIVVKWKTCQEHCPHLIEDEETSKGSMGKHTWSKLDLPSLIQLSKNHGLINLKLTEDKIERVLNGIFIFELDEKNSKIKVITIEDVEIMENKEWLQTTGNAAC